MTPTAKKIVLLLMIGLALLPAFGCKSRRAGRAKKTATSFSAWPEYRAKDGTFTAKLPTEPVVDRQPLHNRERIAYSSRSGSEYYRVTVYLTPDDARAQKNAANPKWLEPYADTWSKSNHQDVKVGPLSAVDVSWADAKFKYRGRVIGSSDGHVVYMLRARWTGNEPANVQPFFDAFKVGTYTPPVASSSPGAGASATPGAAASAAASGTPSSPAASASGSPAVSASTAPGFDEDDDPSPEPSDKIDVKEDEDDEDE